MAITTPWYGGMVDSDTMKFYQDIGFLMTKKSRIVPEVLQIHNICFEFGRKFGAMYENFNDILPAAEEHVVRFYPDLVGEVVAGTWCNFWVPQSKL